MRLLRVGIGSWSDYVTIRTVSRHGRSFIKRKHSRLELENHTLLPLVTLPQQLCCSQCRTLLLVDSLKLLLARCTYCFVQFSLPIDTHTHRTQLGPIEFVYRLSRFVSAIRCSCTEAALTNECSRLGGCAVITLGKRPDAEGTL